MVRHSIGFTLCSQRQEICKQAHPARVPHVRLELPPVRRVQQPRIHRVAGLQPGDFATAADNSPIISDTMAHSSHVTYTGSDSAAATTAWLTTTLNLRVPRVADDTSFVAKVVVAPRSVHAPLDHSCHWYTTPDGTSPPAVSVTVLVAAGPDRGYAGDDVTVTVIAFHSIVIA